MTVVSTLKATSVRIKGLENLDLPFVDHWLGNDLDSTLPLLKVVNEKAKYFVKSIDGLGPPDQTVVIAKTASGGSYQGKTSADREIVVLIGLNPDWAAGETPQLLRNNLYALLNPGYDPRVDFQIFSGIFPFFHVYAYVTKFEPVMFDANPVVQITFQTLNPTFRAFSKTDYWASDLSEKNPNVYNWGTAPVGFQFSVKFTASRGSWSIKDARQQSVGMTFNNSFHSGDLLTVSTVPGNKFVHLKPHRGKVQNALGIMTNDSEWMTLHPGNNAFVVPPKVSQWDWGGDFTFLAQFWGI